MAEIRYLNYFDTRRIDSDNKLLLGDFTCIDTRDIAWFVPAGTQTDGKSVPEQLEILIGDPFEGVTEVAAVVHDYYCATYKTSKRSQKDTHRIFRELTLYEMKKKYPLWQKPWQYTRAHLMWAAVRSWNFFKHKEWL